MSRDLERQDDVAQVEAQRHSVRWTKEEEATLFTTKRDGATINAF